MDRLTIPDEPIEGGMRRAVIDTRAVKEQAMGIYWRLKDYEDTKLTPEQIGEMDQLYLDKCQEVTELKKRLEWIPVTERLPGEDGDYLVTMTTHGYFKGQPYTNWLCWDGDDQEWTDTDGDIIPEQDNVIAWRPIPEPHWPEEEQDA